MMSINSDHARDAGEILFFLRVFTQRYVAMHMDGHTFTFTQRRRERNHTAVFSFNLSAEDMYTSGMRPSEWASTIDNEANEYFNNLGEAENVPSL